MSLALISTATIAASTLFAWGHEEWLLTPGEIARLSVTPMPTLFTHTMVMSLAAFMAAGIAVTVLIAEQKFSHSKTGYSRRSPRSQASSDRC